MKKPFFFYRIILSIRSKEFYKLVIQEHFMRSFVYLLVLSFLCSLIPAAAYSFKSMTAMTIFSELIQDPNCPDFTLKSGQLDIKGNQVFIFSDEVNQKYKIIFDPTGTASFNELAGYENGYLLTSTKIVNYGAATDPTVIPYTFFMSPSVITKADLLESVDFYLPAIFIFIFCIVVFLGVIYSFFLSLVASSISYFTRTLTGLKITYSQNYKISIYAMTLPLFIISILFAFSFTYAQLYHFMIFIVIYGIFSGSVMTYIQKSST